MKDNIQRNCIIVLGMHRSGTSAIAGVLKLLGVNLGRNLLPPNEFNQKGFFENIEILNLNNNILDVLSSQWDDQLSLPDNWLQQEKLTDFKPQAVEIIASEFQESSLIGIKDPRMCLLITFWQDVLRDLGMRVCYIIIVRNPVEVAQSLEKRDNFSREKTEVLWMNAMLSAERHSRGYPRIFISFDQLLNRTEKTIEEISGKLSLRLSKHFNENAGSIHAFLEPSLKHYNLFSRVDSSLMPLTVTMYKYFQKLSALGCADDHDILQHIDVLREKYYKLSNLFYNKDLLTQIRTYYQCKPTSHHAQLFIDTGTGFSEKNSIKKDVSGMEQHMEFDLSDYRNINKLRFDPLNEKVALKLRQIRIVKKNSSINEMLDCSANALFRKNGLMIFDSQDPQIFIHSGDFAEAKSVIFEIDYIAWGLEVYHYIAEEKTALMNAKNAELACKAQELAGKIEELASLNEKIEVLSGLLKSREAALHEKDSTIASLNEKIEELAELFESQEAALLGKSEQLAILNEKTEGLSGLLESREAALGGKSEELASLRGQLEDLVVLIKGQKEETGAALAKIIKMLSQRAEKLNNELQKQKATISDLNSEIKICLYQQQQLGGQCRDKDAYINILENSLSLKLGRRAGKIIAAPARFFFRH